MSDHRRAVMLGAIAAVLFAGAVGVRMRLAAAVPASSASDRPEEVVLSYVAAARDGRWDQARSFWDPEELARADRLGIRYRGVPLKIDSASPLMILTSEPGRDPASVRARTVTSDGDRAVVDVSTGGVADSVACRYHLRRSGGGWRLVTPEMAIAGAWPTRETAYLRLHEEPPRRIDPAAVSRLDSCVARTCRVLEVPAERVALLRREKIDYYFATDEPIVQMAGVPTRGVALLQTDVVVTSEPCHLHELVHLLVNFAAGEVGLFALPVLQEGIAVRLGGRWGRAPDALREMGAYALTQNLIGLDDLLTWDGATSQSADLTYAPAGVIAGLLLDRLGGRDFLALYRGCSGSLGQVRALSADEVKRRLAASLNEPAAEVDKEILSRAAADSTGDLEPGPFAGSVGDTIAVVRSGGLLARITDRGEWIGVEVTLADTNRDGEASGAILLSAADGGPARRAVPSRLFAEVLPSLADQGELAALVFDPRETGLYDFRCDLLLAKHVQEFRPVPGYAPIGGRAVLLRFRRDLLPADPSDLTWRLVRP